MNKTTARPITNLLTVAKGEPIGRGITRPCFGTVECVVKPDGTRGVMAEYLTAELGRWLGLPVAPGFITDIDGSPHYVVMKVGTEKFEPLSKAAAIHLFPEAAAHVSVFDALVCNTDRHDWNMANVNGQMFIYDHGHAMDEDDLRSELPIRLKMVDRRNREYVAAMVERIKAIPRSLLDNMFGYLSTVLNPDDLGYYDTSIDFDGTKEALWERIQDFDNRYCVTEGNHLVIKGSFDGWRDNGEYPWNPGIVCDCSRCGNGVAVASESSPFRDSCCYRPASPLMAQDEVLAAEWTCGIVGCFVCHP